MEHQAMVTTDIAFDPRRVIELEAANPRSGDLYARLLDQTIHLLAELGAAPSDALFVAGQVVRGSSWASFRSGRSRLATASATYLTWLAPPSPWTYVGGQTVSDRRPVSAPVLRRLCEEVLAEERRVLVVDECQNLRTIWHQQLRFLHDHQEAQFALLLVGGMNASETLKRDQQLWSRVGMRMEFQPLKDQELLDTLNRLDPILANTDDELLARIDDKDCRGNLRNWTKVLGLARQFGPAGMDRLDERVTRAIFAARSFR
jgi:hypothetical protein